MQRHRKPRQRLSKHLAPDNEPRPLRPDRNDLDGLIYLMRDNLGKADAFITAAEREIEESWSTGDGDSTAEDDTGDSALRRRSRIEHLIEAGKLAVRAAGHTTEEFDNPPTEGRMTAIAA